MRMTRLLAAFVAAGALGACTFTPDHAPNGVKVSDLPEAAPLNGSEYVAAVQNGRSVKVKAADLRHFAQGGEIK